VIHLKELRGYAPSFLEISYVPVPGLGNMSPFFMFVSREISSLAGQDAQAGGALS
jgi:hypothetical protein